jgi:hypothetical protein
MLKFFLMNLIKGSYKDELDHFFKTSTPGMEWIYPSCHRWIDRDQGCPAYRIFNLMISQGADFFT